MTTLSLHFWVKTLGLEARYELKMDYSKVRHIEVRIRIRVRVWVRARL